MWPSKPIAPSKADRNKHPWESGVFPPGGGLRHESGGQETMVFASMKTSFLCSFLLAALAAMADDQGKTAGDQAKNYHSSSLGPISPVVDSTQAAIAMVEAFGGGGWPR